MMALPYRERVGRDHPEQAGIDAEKQLAHYLNREFGDDQRVQVYFGLRLPLGGGEATRQDAVQMDVLLVHRHGMAIVESKSVHDEVRVNAQGEWVRTFRGKALGMPSPVEQVKGQAAALRKLLMANKKRLRERKFLGLVQGGMRYCPIETFVAISDEGKIRRDKQGMVPEVMKADQIAAKVRKRIEEHRKAGSILGWLKPTDGDDGLYVLTDEELRRVWTFLKENHRPRGTW